MAPGHRSWQRRFCWLLSGMIFFLGTGCFQHETTDSLSAVLKNQDVRESASRQPAPEMVVAAMMRRSAPVLASAHVQDGFVSVSHQPLAPWVLETDRDAFARLRVDLLQGTRPISPDSVSITGIIQALAYSFPPAHQDHPLSLLTEVVECPWNADHYLVCLGVQAVGEDTKEVLVQDLQAEIAFHSRHVSGYRRLGEEVVQATLLTKTPNPRPVQWKAGQGTVALYEVVPIRPSGTSAQEPGHPLFHLAPTRDSPELLRVQLLYQDPKTGAKRLLEQPVGLKPRPFTEASPDLRLSAVLAGFGLLLRKDPLRGSVSWEQLQEMVQTLQEEQPDRKELLEDLLKMIDAAPLRVLP